MTANDAVVDDDGYPRPRPVVVVANVSVESGRVVSDGTHAAPALVEALRQRGPDSIRQRGCERVGVGMFEIPLPIRFVIEYGRRRVRFSKDVSVDALSVRSSR